MYIPTLMQQIDRHNARVAAGQNDPRSPMASTPINLVATRSTHAAHCSAIHTIHAIHSIHALDLICACRVNCKSLYAKS